MAATQVLKLKRDMVSSSTGGGGVLVYSLASKKKKRKTSRGLSFPEKLIRHAVRAQAQGAVEYCDRHDRSTRKRRDGWMRDLPVNVFKSQRNGMKKFKLSRILF